VATGGEIKVRVKGVPVPITQADIDNRFDYHAPSPERVRDHTLVRTTLRDVATLFVRILPPGRDCSRAIADLEDAMFHANAAIAREAEPETA
jgi:hypothetical protein